MNVKNALQIVKACVEAYENKLPQGFYNKISSYGVTMDTPMKWINMGAVRTVDSSAEHLALSVQKSLLSHELAPIPISLFWDDGSMISASLK